MEEFISERKYLFVSFIIQRSGARDQCESPFIYLLDKLNSSRAQVWSYIILACVLAAEPQPDVHTHSVLQITVALSKMSWIVEAKV